MGGMISIDETRTMIEAVIETPPLPTFLRRTFFGGGNKTYLTEQIDFDYKKGNLAMAPFVAPKVGGIPMEREGFETRTLSIPKIAPERVITVENLKNRSMGEAIYSSKTPAQRAVELQAEDYDYLDNAISLREEWMARQLLINGKIDISGEVNSGNVVDFSVDYRFTNKESLTGDDLWTNPAAKPLQQFVAWRKEIVENCGIDPNVLIMRSDTAMMLVDHPNFLKYYDTMRYNFGTIEPYIKEPLVTFYGRLPQVGADIYAYDASFLDPVTKEMTPFIPDNTVLFASTTARGRFDYGAVTFLTVGENFMTVAATRVPQVFIDTDSSVKTLRLTARPLPMPLNVDGWAVRIVA
ncbi:MAG: major capsid protein [Synergistaceae bacterium]|jgi:hypothetical protein|nr:major capsid protein [Synergistaceae bacterium]